MYSIALSTVVLIPWIFVTAIFFPLTPLYRPGPLGKLYWYCFCLLYTSTQTYRYRTRGIVYDFAPTPYIPYPEVVSYIENQDGTITLEENGK